MTTKLIRKYDFTGDTREFQGVTLRRIRRCSDGLIGGWLESDVNLSHKGPCFVYDEAAVFKEGWVSGAASVKGSARVSEGACIGGVATIAGTMQIVGRVFINSGEIGGTGRISPR